MAIEYKLGKTKSGKYQGLKCGENDEAFIKSMNIYGFGDCISFEKKTGANSSFGSDWGLHSLGCFKELKPYTRLIDIPGTDIKKLAARIHEVLYNNSEDERLNTPPKINEKDPNYKQILEELVTLQGAQKKLVASGKIVFPEVSSEELDWQELW